MHTDGRVRRGLERRRLLLDAALRVVQRDGVGALTHRSVAAEAGVPKSAATYHFESIEELLVVALTDSAESYAADLERALDAGGSSTAVLARHLADYTEAHRARCLAEYELYLLAARRPALRTAALRCTQLLEGIAHRWTDDPAAITAFVAVTDGLMLQALLRDEPVDQAAVQLALDHVLGQRT